MSVRGVDIILKNANLFRGVIREPFQLNFGGSAMRKLSILALIGVLVTVCLSSPAFARERNFSLYTDFPVLSDYVDRRNRNETFLGNQSDTSNEHHVVGFMSPTLGVTQLFVGYIASTVDVYEKGNKDEHPSTFFHTDFHAGEAGILVLDDRKFGVSLGFIWGDGKIEKEDLETADKKSQQVGVWGFRIGMDYELIQLSKLWNDSVLVSVPIVWRTFQFTNNTSFETASIGLQINF